MESRSVVVSSSAAEPLLSSSPPPPVTDDKNSTAKSKPDTAASATGGHSSSSSKRPTSLVPLQPMAIPNSARPTFFVHPLLYYRHVFRLTSQRDRVARVLVVSERSVVYLCALDGRATWSFHPTTIRSIHILPSSDQILVSFLLHPTDLLLQFDEKLSAERVNPSAATMGYFLYLMRRESPTLSIVEAQDYQCVAQSGMVKEKNFRGMNGFVSRLVDGLKGYYVMLKREVDAQRERATQNSELRSLIRNGISNNASSGRNSMRHLQPLTVSAALASSSNQLSASLNRSNVFVHDTTEVLKHLLIVEPTQLNGAACDYYGRCRGMSDDTRGERHEMPKELQARINDQNKKDEDGTDTDTEDDSEQDAAKIIFYRRGVAVLLGTSGLSEPAVLELFAKPPPLSHPSSSSATSAADAETTAAELFGSLRACTRRGDLVVDEYGSMFLLTTTTPKKTISAEDESRGAGGEAREQQQQHQQPSCTAELIGSLAFGVDRLVQRHRRRHYEEGEDVEEDDMLLATTAADGSDTNPSWKHLHAATGTSTSARNKFTKATVAMAMKVPLSQTSLTIKSHRSHDNALHHPSSSSSSSSVAAQESQRARSVLEDLQRNHPAWLQLLDILDGPAASLQRRRRRQPGGGLIHPSSASGAADASNLAHLQAQYISRRDDEDAEALLKTRWLNLLKDHVQESLTVVIHFDAYSAGCMHVADDSVTSLEMFLRIADYFQQKRKSLEAISCKAGPASTTTSGRGIAQLAMEGRTTTTRSSLTTASPPILLTPKQKRRWERSQRDEAEAKRKAAQSLQAAVDSLHQVESFLDAKDGLGDFISEYGRPWSEKPQPQQQGVPAETRHRREGALSELVALICKQRLEDI